MRAPSSGQLLYPAQGQLEPKCQGHWYPQTFVLGSRLLVSGWSGVLGTTSARGELFIVRTREAIHLPLRMQGPGGEGWT